MASQGQRKNNYPVLKMPLDLSLPVDNEVYQIFDGFKSGIEAKNFLCSAVLYYARSPLVLAANAIKDNLDKANLDLKFSQIMVRLDELSQKMETFSSLGFKKSCMSALDVVNSNDVVSDATSSALLSLKQKFKI